MSFDEVKKTYTMPIPEVEANITINGMHLSPAQATAIRAAIIGRYVDLDSNVNMEDEAELADVERSMETLSEISKIIMGEK